MKGIFLFVFLLGPALVEAQAYPSKPIRWIVPYPGGGITDSVTRIVTQKMATSLGQPVVVDNRPGANSILGTDLAAKAAPDGYTIVTVIAGHASFAFTGPGLRYSRTIPASSQPVAMSRCPSPLTSTNRTPSAPRAESSIVCRRHAWPRSGGC